MAAESFNDGNVDLLQTLNREGAPLFAVYGEGTELEAYPFLRVFGNKTWSFIQAWAPKRWKFYADIVRDRKVGATTGPLCCPLADSRNSLATRLRLPRSPHQLSVCA